MYCIPIWNILEEMAFKQTLVNHYLIKQLPSRKSKTVNINNYHNNRQTNTETKPKGDFLLNTQSSSNRGFVRKVKPDSVKPTKNYS